MSSTILMNRFFIMLYMNLMCRRFSVQDNRNVVSLFKLNGFICANATFPLRYKLICNFRNLSVWVITLYPLSLYKSSV